MEPPMFPNSWPNRQRGDPEPTRTIRGYFDFAVSQRPQYTRGSGPPLQLPTLQPNHKNKDGVILDLMEAAGELRYLVGSISRPELRVSVRMMDILDWVSPKTFEDFQWARSNETRQLERARKANLDSKANSIPGPGFNEARDEITTDSRNRVPKIGRIVVEIDGSSGGSRRLSSADELSMVLPSQASFTSPSGKRGLAEIVNLADDSEEEEEQEELERTGEENPDVKMNLGSQMDEHSPGAANTKHCSRSTIPLPKGISTAFTVTRKQRNQPNELSLQTRTSRKPGKPLLSTSATSGIGSRSTRSNSQTLHSRQTTSNSPSSGDATGTRQYLGQQRKQTMSTINSTESMKVKPTLSSLPVKPQPSSPTRKSSTLIKTKPTTPNSAGRNSQSSQSKFRSFFLPGQSLSSTKIRRKTPTPPLDDLELEAQEEWEVAKILAHKSQIDEDGSKVTYYKINWVGEYEDTWEPAENVGAAAIKAYKISKKILKAAKAQQGQNLDRPRHEEKKRKRRREEKRNVGEEEEEDYVIKEARSESKHNIESDRSRKDRRRISRSRSQGPAALDDYNSNKPRKRISHPPAVSLARVHGRTGDMEREEEEEDDDDDDDKDTKMVDAEGTIPSSSEGLFISDSRAPVANMFEPGAAITSTRILPNIAKPDRTSNGYGTNGSGKQAVKQTIEIGSSREAEPIPKGGERVVINISSGVESSGDEDVEKDELA